MGFIRHSKTIGNISGDLKGYHEQSFQQGNGGFSAAMIRMGGKHFYNPPSGSLRGAWLFNEGGLSRFLHDYSPYAHHSDEFDTDVVWVYRGAYSDGTGGQHISISDRPSLRMPGDMTVIIWTIPEDPTSSYGGVKIAKWAGGGGTPGENEWICSPQAGSTGTDAGSFAIEIGSTTYIAAATSAPTMGQMYFIAGVRRGEYIEYWRDGVLHSRTYVGPTATNTLDSNPVRFFNQGDNLGSHGNTGKGTFISSTLYNEALSGTVIENIYNAGPWCVSEDLEYAI